MIQPQGVSIQTQRAICKLHRVIGKTQGVILQNT